MFDSDLYSMLSGTLVRWILATSFGFFLSEGWISAGDQASYTKLVGGIIAGALALAWSAYQKYGHAKVKAKLAAIAPGYKSDGSVGAIKPLILFAILALSLSYAIPSHAADMVTKAAPVAAAAPVQYCTPTSCTGFYAGAGLAGNGTNADIVGSGIDGSVFAGGGIPFADVGWMSWNGTSMIGFEVGGGDQINVGTAVNGVGSSETGYDFYEEMQWGGNLAALINNGSSPITPPTSLLQYMMAPYLAFGVDERPWGTGWRTGAGAKFAIGDNMFLDLGYRYINYGSATNGALTFNAENLVFVKFNRAF